MKYVRIEENTQARVKVVMEELVEEARGLIYQNGCTERDKDYCNNLLNDVMGAIVKVIKDYKLDTCAVTVWNKDTVNPGNIDKDLIDVMWDYRAEAQFIIKRKMTGYNLMNRVHKLVDYVNYLIWSADRTAELEQETHTQETETPQEPITNYDEEKNLYNHDTGEKIEETEDEWEVPEEFYRQEEEANRQALEAARANALQVMKERGELEDNSDFKPIEIDFPNGKYIQVWKTSDGYECNEFNEDGEKISHNVYGHLEDIDLDYGTSLWRKE